MENLFEKDQEPKFLFNETQIIFKSGKAKFVKKKKKKKRRERKKKEEGIIY